jgi:hypothetical protein
VVRTELKRIVLLSFVLAPFTVPRAALAHYETEKDRKEADAYRVAHPLSTNNFDPWKLLEMALTPAYAATSNVSITTQGNYRVIHSNGLPNHDTGTFPNK